MTTKTVWKFPLAIGGWQNVSMPNGATIVEVAMQFGTPCIWALVDPKEPKKTLRVRIVGTGHDIEDAEMLKHIGTAHDTDLGLVWHVFAFVGVMGAT